MNTVSRWTAGAERLLSPRQATSNGGLLTAAVAAVAAVGLALGGCGSSSHSSTTATNTPSGGSSANPTASSTKIEQFSQCMRSHGVPTFPDPTSQGTFQLSASLTASPQFKSADDACRSWAPAGPLRGQAPTAGQLSQALKFVHCMRGKGVNLSDPTPQGRFQRLPTNVNSPQFKQALYSCRSLLPPGNGFGTGR